MNSTMTKKSCQHFIIALALSLLLGSTYGFSLARGCRTSKNLQDRLGANWNPRRRDCTDLSTTQIGSAVTLLRGGAVPVSQTLVAKVCSGLLALNGVSLLLAPSQFVSKFYKTDIEKDSFESYLLEAIGAVSLGMAVNVYLALVHHMPTQRAMGFALLPRLVIVVFNSLLGRKLIDAGGTKQFLSVNTILMTWTTFSLCTGAGKPLTAAKVFSFMAILKGLFLVVNPVAGCNKYLGIDVSKQGMEKSRALCRGLGNALTTSAILMGILAFGVDPTKAAAYTCIVWMALLIEMAFRTKSYQLMGETSPRTQIIHLCIATLFASGFLFATP